MLLLHVICGLTACTPGSAPGPKLGNEYGKTLPFFSRTSWLDFGERKGREREGKEMAKEKETERKSTDVKKSSNKNKKR